MRSGRRIGRVVGVAVLAGAVLLLSTRAAAERDRSRPPGGNGAGSRTSRDNRRNPEDPSA